MNVSQNWQARFALIEKAGGPKLPKLKALSPGERFRVVMSFWAFFFGPFFYLAKGMWRKAITLSVLGYGIVFVAIFVLVLSGYEDEALFRGLGFGVSALFGIRAIPDYYRKMVLADNRWW